MEFQRNPVDPVLNVAIKMLARKYNPCGWDQVKTFAEAPSSLEYVQDYERQHGKLCIAEEASDDTIFDCRDTNWHFRAWHDRVHADHNFEMTAAGEANTAYVQCAHMFEFYGDTAQTRYWFALLLTEVVGMAHFFQRHGSFPMDQRQFVIATYSSWETEANALMDDLTAGRHEGYLRATVTAARRAASRWGVPY